MANELKVMKTKSIIAFADYFMRNRRKVYTQIKEVIDENNIPLMIINNCKDIWARDFMPFQRHDGKLVFYKYAPDYLRNKETYITPVEQVALTPLTNNEKDSNISFTDYFSKENIIHTDLVIDGGNLIKCVDKNGEKCVIMTQKVLFENHDKSHLETLMELERVLQSQIILIPWDKNEEYGHADGMVRFIEDGKLLLNNYSESDKTLYDQLMLALNDSFEIHELKYGKYIDMNSWCHINYLDTGNIILVPAVNSPSDVIAKSQIATLTGKPCELIYMPDIVNSGGALNCISWDFLSL